MLITILPKKSRHAVATFASLLGGGWETPDRSQWRSFEQIWVQVFTLLVLVRGPGIRRSHPTGGSKSGRKMSKSGRCLHTSSYCVFIIVLNHTSAIHWHMETAPFDPFCRGLWFSVDLVNRQGTSTGRARLAWVEWETSGKTPKVARWFRFIAFDSPICQHIWFPHCIWFPGWFRFIAFVCKTSLKFKTICNIILKPGQTCQNPWQKNLMD